MMLFSAAFICAAVAAAVFILAAAVRVRAAAAALTVILSGFIMQPDVCYTVLGHLYALIGVGNLIIHIVLSLVGIVRRAGHCAAVCTVAVADFRAYTGIRKVCHTDGVRCSVHNTVVAGNNGLCTHILVFCVVAVLALLYDGKPAIGRLRKDFFLHVMPFQNTALGVIRAVTERAILTAGRCDLVIGTVHIVIVFLFGQFLPNSIVRIFVTFNSLFGNFLSFAIPLIILGLVTPAIGELGKGAGKLLAITALLAYGSTIFSGFFTFFSCEAIFPSILPANTELAAVENPGDFMLTPYFVVAMPPLMDVMTALLLSFTIGLGLSYIEGTALKDGFTDFKEIITMLIEAVIIPLLPLHIFGIFLNMTVSGQVAGIIAMFLKVILVIFVLHVLLLLMQFSLAGSVSHKNPLRLLRNMLPAYATALGTQSSAATIPVTLAQAIKNGVRQNIAIFVIPLCATIHLAGSTMKIVACAMAILLMSGEPITLTSFAGFILMLGITMVAAPGVPGGAIMAALGLLQSMLGFNETLQALMIALYIAMDSFGTACNVTGDGAIAILVDKIAGKTVEEEVSQDTF